MAVEGGKPRLPRQYQNWINNAQGHDFEKAIEWACVLYARTGTAWIEKTPEPFLVMSKGKSGGVFQGRFTARAQPDFQGTVAGGRSIVFEAKYTTTDRLRRDALTEKQMEALEQHGRIRGYRFCLRWHSGQLFRCAMDPLAGYETVLGAEICYRSGLGAVPGKV